MPSFVRFSKILKTATFAVALMFGLQNSFAVTNCPSGTVPQENVFQYYLNNCASTGISNFTSFTQTSTPVSDGDGSWTSYFQDFRVKGRAYCSTTAPATAADTGAPCASYYPRRPMATSINTTTPGGTQCWCQATEHQKFSTVSMGWVAPFQKIYAKYVYLKDMGDACEDSCAAYCSYMGTQALMLNTSPNDRFISENLRATIYDSLLECIPTENKITYINKTDNDEWDITDYDYYTGSVTLKTPEQKPNFVFKGWCDGAESCSNPMAANSVQTGWSGRKTLYAQWEQTQCEPGVKSIWQNGTLACLDECADGYEPQLDPFRAASSGHANDPTFCQADGSYHSVTGLDWYASFMSAGFAVSGHSYCSTTAPTASSAVDDACPFGAMASMAENIDTGTEGPYCWCQVTEFEQQYQRAPLAVGTYPLKAKYVYAGEHLYCEQCPHICSSILYTNYLQLRIGMYRSIYKCVKSKYSLVLRDGDRIVNTISDYSVTDTVTLPEPAPSADKIGYKFAGWCEDLSNCETPLVGKQTGLFGNKTLYAKWDAELYNIKYENEVPANAPMVYSVAEPVRLVAAETNNDVEFEGWYDNANYTGNAIDTLPVSTHQTEDITLYAKTTQKPDYAVVEPEPATCGDGYKEQTNVFADLQQCGVQGSIGYEHTGNASTSDAETNTWVSYFPSFRVKGRAYCSITMPSAASRDVPCPSIQRRPMATTINTTASGGTQCWCQAIEHQQFSTISRTWAAPFQKIYANYVYLKDMGSNCNTSCAAYCSYMTQNLILDGSVDNPVIGKNLRATIYDSLHKCAPIENKITYMNVAADNEWDIIDYQYYTGSVKLKSALVRPEYSFKGWCETETCNNPMAGDTTKTGWSGEKTLYAQWERSSCGTGLKSKVVNGVLTCLDECEEGYEEQINPFKAINSCGWSSDEHNYCAHTGNAGATPTNNTWASYFSSIYKVSGTAYCSSTRPPTNEPAQYAACSNGKLQSMFEEINLSETGDMCWCRVTGYEQLNDCNVVGSIKKGTVLDLDGKYVFAGEVPNCNAMQNSCTGRCADMYGNYSFSSSPDAIGVSTQLLRISLYNSLKKCVKKTYTLTLQSGDTTLNTIPNYSVTDTITLPTPPASAEQEGYEFVGWCEDLDNCDEPLTGTQTGLSGDKTLYAKWTPILYQIEYKNVVVSESAPTLYSAVNTVVLTAPEVSEDLEFEGYYDNPEFEGEQIESLPNNLKSAGMVTLYAKTAVRAASGGSGTGGTSSGVTYNNVHDYTAPATCENGYTKNNGQFALLDPKKDTEGTLTASVSGDGGLKKFSSAVQEIKDRYDTNEELGIWGLHFAEGYNPNTMVVINPFYSVYGESSCNTQTGSTPPDNLEYSNQTMVGQDNSGPNCWCKMTGFQIYNQQSKSVSDTPWVYLQQFESSGSTSAKDKCAHDCASSCRVEMSKNAFFRSQVFGEYSACKPETYSIEYVLNGGNWPQGFEPPVEYTVVYKSITIPNNVTRDGFEFAGWCEENDPMSSTCKGPNDTITIGTGSSGNRTFYARWKTKIHFNAGTVKVEKDNPGSMNDQDVYYNQENIELTTNEFRRDGYDFSGWTCSVDGDDETLVEVTNNGTSYVINKFEYDNSITCNAQWTAKEFNISYQGSNDINIAQSWINEHPRTFTVEEENDIVIPAADSENNHYQFAGWCPNVSNDCEELTQVYTITPGTLGDVYLWARWEVAHYDLSYYSDETDYTNTNPLNPEQIEQYNLPTGYDYGTTTILPDLPQSVKPHYDFNGWDVYVNGTKTNETPIKTITSTDDGDKTLVGNWSLHNYKIEYYLTFNFDTSGTPNHTDTYNITDGEKTVYSPTENEIPNHFEFSGWFDCTNGVPDENASAITVINASNGGDIKLCAQWNRISCPDGNYKVGQDCHSCATETSNLYPNADGTTATDISSCYATCPVPPVCPANSHDCAYDVKVNENNINYYNEGLEPCLTTYVCDDHYSGSTCEPDTYNVTYYDGENIIDALAENYGTYTFGEGLTLPTGQDIEDYYQKLHYTFVGWYDNAEFEGDVIQEISAEDYGNKVFYSKWEPTVYHIEFSYGKAGNRTTGFTGNTDTQNVNFGDKDIPLNSNGFAIAGYEFDHWTCSATYDNGETYTGNYQNNAEITEYVYNSDMLCEAHWMANSYSLSYNCGNGGELADGQSETVSVDYDAEYVLNNSVCKVRPNYTLINWTCSNDLDLTQSVWNITDNSTCTAHWEETRYAITYLNTDGTQFNSLSPTTYLSSATPLTVPTTNPANTEHADFVGWCDDASLTQNCALTREIPSGSSGDITFYAKWVASACPAGQYLDSASASCLNCESGYTSAAWSATKPEDCYYDWNCEYSCPDNAESCSLVSGVSNGRIYYGSNETYSCDINVVCKDGYTFDASSNQCGANHYNITYHLNNGAWASATDVHPNSYTVGTSSISISQPSRDWHSFDGWCVGEDDCNNPVKNFVINPAETVGDIELFAQWSFTSCQTGYTPENTANGKICVPQYYNITYMDGNVELEHLATRFTIEDTTIQLASISNPGYIFDGWCVNTSSCAPSNMVKGILQGPWTVGDKTLYAQWTKEEFVCDSGKYLHIGNDAACLYTQKPSSPAFAVGKGNKKYYLKMTKKTEHPDGLPMNEESNKQINVLYDDELYNVHDASVNDAPVEFFEQ